MAAPGPGIRNVPDNLPDSSHKSDTVGLSHWCPTGNTADNGETLSVIITYNPTHDAKIPNTKIEVKLI